MRKDSIKMTWITIPSSLSAGAVSDISHLTSIYDQLTDGVHNISVSSITSENLVINTLLNQSFLEHMPKSDSIAGDQSSNIDNILKNSGYNPEDYQNQLMMFSGTNYSSNYDNFSVLVEAQNTNNVWIWQLIGEREWD